MNSQIILRTNMAGVPSASFLTLIYAFFAYYKILTLSVVQAAPIPQNVNFCDPFLVTECDYLFKRYDDIRRKRALPVDCFEYQQVGGFIQVTWNCKQPLSWFQLVRDLVGGCYIFIFLHWPFGILTVYLLKLSIN